VIENAGPSDQRVANTGPENRRPNVAAGKCWTRKKQEWKMKDQTLKPENAGPN